MYTLKLIFLLLICSLFSACSSLSTLSSYSKADSILAKPPYFSSWRSSDFLHGVWHNEALSNLQKVQGKSSLHELNIYIHGDGLPWVTRTKIAIDPSPRHSLTWSLFLKDPKPSLFISRPCYFGTLKSDENCNPGFWTSGRYSAKVVASLRKVILEERRERQVNKINLIGFSGGGALVMLIAAELGEEVQRSLTVTTIAANLDTNAWTTQHDYSPLVQSMNPSGLAPLNIKQRHFCGRRDTNIPVSILDNFFTRQGGTCQMVDAEHVSGWLDNWPLFTRDTLNE